MQRNVIFFVLTVVAYFAFPYMIELEALKGNELFEKHVIGKKKEISDFLLMGAGALFVIWQAKGHMKSLWQTTVSPVFANMQTSLQTHIDTVQDSANKEFAENFEEASQLLRHNHIREVVQKATSAELKEVRSEYRAQLYGMHTKSELGLSAAIDSILGKYLDPKEPHRSSYSKMINVIETPEGSFRWDEVSSYKIHSICHDKDYRQASEVGPQAPIKHPIRYRSTCELIPGGQGLAQHKLKIKVSGEVIFDSERDLVDESDELATYEENGCTAKFEIVDGGIVVDFYKEILLSDAWTTVEIFESSISSDQNLTVGMSIPVCKAEISITLPQGYEFTNSAFSIGKWEKTMELDYALVARNDGWVFPGLVASIDWKKGA